MIREAAGIIDPHDYHDYLDDDNRNADTDTCQRETFRFLGVIIDQVSALVPVHCMVCLKREISRKDIPHL